MLSDIVTIKWFDSKESLWVTDYIQSDSNRYCVISITEKAHIYNFWISKKLVEDIYPLLDKAMNQIRKNEGLSPDIRVINLGLSCNNESVSGRFEIYKKDTKDDESS